MFVFVFTYFVQASYDCDNPKESESPRFQAILRVTSAPRKRFPGDIKSFSHELNSKGVRPYPFWKPRRLNNLEVFMLINSTKTRIFCYYTFEFMICGTATGSFINDTYKV